MEDYTKEKEVNEEKSVDCLNIDEVFMEKAESLVEKANDSFGGLCKTLEMEQLKLAELEQRRLKLQEEMHNLRLEIENEKRNFEDDVEKVTQSRTCENNLPDPVDITMCNIELKSDFMREFLSQHARELKDQSSQLKAADGEKVDVLETSANNDKITDETLN